MTLTRQQAKLHRQAEQLVRLTRDLTEDERHFVLDNWQEAADPAHVLARAHFTPAGLAVDMNLHVNGHRIIDLCAGIGRLAFHARDAWIRTWEGAPPRDIVCVEANPQYVQVGRKTVPEATWICADVLQPLGHLGRFDCAISNPPFGRARRTADGPRYRGPLFEYHVIAVASRLARRGVFLLPAPSAPFRMSGGQPFREERGHECIRFEAETGIRLDANVGIDTTHYAEGWHALTAPPVEVVTCDFTETADAEPLPAAALPRRQVPAPANVEQLGLFA